MQQLVGSLVKEELLSKFISFKSGNEFHRDGLYLDVSLSLTLPISLLTIFIRDIPSEIPAVKMTNPILSFVFQSN